MMMQIISLMPKILKRSISFFMLIYFLLCLLMSYRKNKINGNKTLFQDDSDKPTLILREFSRYFER